MSDRVTWETCPHCGGPVAIGWAADRGASGDRTGPSPQERPVEADCCHGCRLSSAELAAFTGPPRTGQPIPG